MSTNFNSSLEDTGSCPKKETDDVFITVNAMKFVGRTLAAYPRGRSQHFLTPLLQTLFTCLGLEDSMATLADFSYMEDGVLHAPFTALLEDYDAGIYNVIEEVAGEVTFQVNRPSRRRAEPINGNQKDIFHSYCSQLAFLAYLRQYIKKYLEDNEARAANTEMEQTLLAFADSFDLSLPEVDLLRILAVIRYMELDASGFKEYFKMPSKKYPIAQWKEEIRRRRKDLASILGSDDQDILQEGEMFDFSIFANRK